MIIHEYPNTNPSEKCYVSSFKCTGTVTKPDIPQIVDCCDISCIEKQSPEINKVLSGDKTAFITTKQLDTDVITYQLCLGSTTIDLDGSTYSEIEITDLNTYVCLNWESVFNDLGPGEYTLKINYDILGVQYTESDVFVLCPNEICESLDTVKIEYWLNGEFKDGRKYCDNYFCMRIEGTLNMIDPLDESEYYKSKSLKLEPINTGIFERWELNTYFSTLKQGNEIIKQLGHADRLRITTPITEKQPRYELIRDGKISINNPQGTKKCFFNITFIEKKQDNSKNSCKC